MKTYIVRGLNEAGETEVEVVVSENDLLKAESIVKDNEEISLMVSDGAIIDFEIEESTGPIHLLSFPMQGC